MQGQAKQDQPTDNAKVAADLPVADMWFAVAPMRDHILRIREAWIDPYLTGDLWLIRGRDRDLLADTGTGMVSPRLVVEALARNPLIAVACNSWYDHAGGLAYFDERGCHRADAALIAEPTPHSSVADLFVSAEMLLARPSADFVIDSYRMNGCTPTVLFEDGDEIDLGGRQIEVVHVPGNTPGSIVLWEAATGSLFSCDTLFDDPTPALRAKYRQGQPLYSGARRAARIADLERLATLPIRTVYAGHFGEITANRATELIARELAALRG